MKKISLFTLILTLITLFSTILSACTEVEISTSTEPHPLSSESGENTEVMEDSKTVWTQPDQDDEINILLIGSSFAYRFPDELCAMGKELGLKIRVCHAYYSGVTLQTQWNWIRLGDGDYTLNVHGSLPMKGGTYKNLPDILRLYNWDVISVHQTPMAFRTGDYQTSLNSCIYAKNIYQYLRERCPDARYMWYQIWGINIGYTVDEPANCIPTREKQIAMHNASHDVAREMVKEHGVDLVPAGDAWEIIRKETSLGDTLTGRNGDQYGDNLHDGDTGGGQYLNACVWYEVLFQKSCLGNTWRPKAYQLEEEKIPLLQEAAHRAVEEYYGADYIK
jgi:hypothetical protein